jgi:uracil-DNA glycosylase family 4
MTSVDPRRARELLDFYLSSGVETLVGETPVMRFAAATVPSAAGEDAARPIRVPGSAQETAHAAPPAGRLSARDGHDPSRHSGNSPALPAPDEAVMAAREAAKSAATLDELRAILDRFEGCGLKATATQLVFADGNPAARLMLVGEAPGRDEDIEGRPFVGRSGKLLDRMLAAIGLDRSCVYIANVVPWRPPGNRDPSPHETAICLPFIRRQIELCDPDILVCLGKPSMQTLLQINDPISKARGRWFSYHTGKREIRAMPTFHPAFLLRSPLQKRFAWRDFLAIKKALDA